LTIARKAALLCLLQREWEGRRAPRAPGVFGDFAGTLALDREAVEVCRHQFGENYPATVKAELPRAVSLRQVGDFAEVWELAPDNNHHQSEILGENDDEAMRNLDFLSMEQRELGD
jgi:hypothetical protein